VSGRELLSQPAGVRARKLFSRSFFFFPLLFRNCCCIINSGNHNSHSRKRKKKKRVWETLGKRRRTATQVLTRVTDFDRKWIWVFFLKKSSWPLMVFFIQQPGRAHNCYVAM
jgi:hypothetical protein